MQISNEKIKLKNLVLQNTEKQTVPQEITIILFSFEWTHLSRILSTNSKCRQTLFYMNRGLTFGVKGLSEAPKIKQGRQRQLIQ